MRAAQPDPPVLPGFTFSSLLGSGGFSDVYLYEQELPRRKVAVKVLLTDELTAASRAAFVAEANTMAQLSSHPNIVSIFHAAIADDGRPFFVMEYYGGPSLADRYKKAPLSVVEALAAGIRISSAVATAHDKGILHRDIKPGNVLTNDYGALGLTDFGISSRVDTEVHLHTTTRSALVEAGSTTGSGTVGMSIPWSPPEMFDDDPEPDVRSDVFSLAATVYTLLAGRTPFEVVRGSNSTLDLISRIERGVLTPMERTDVPSSMIAVLRKGMAVEPSSRFATAVDLARALQRVELELGFAPTPIEVPNLTLPAQERPVGDLESDDKTRARGVTSIAAQPVAPSVSADVVAPPIVVPPTAVPPPTPASTADAPLRPSAPAESTVLRPARQKESNDTVPTTPRRRWIAPVIASAAALLVTIVVVVMVTNSPATAPADDDGASEADASGAPIDFGEGVPTPVLVSASIAADGASATFSWSNPDPVAGDVFFWWRTDGAATDTAPHETTAESVTIDGIAPGMTVCIEIEIVRDGRSSPEPLAECVP